MLLELMAAGLWCPGRYGRMTFTVRGAFAPPTPPARRGVMLSAQRRAETIPLTALRSESMHSVMMLSVVDRASALRADPLTLRREWQLGGERGAARARIGRAATAYKPRQPRAQPRAATTFEVRQPEAANRSSPRWAQRAAWRGSRRDFAPGARRRRNEGCRGPQVPDRDCHAAIRCQSTTTAAATFQSR